MDLASLAGELAGAGRCVGCGRRGAALCGACARALRRPTLTDGVPDVDRVIAPWAYEGAARALVLALKLRAQRPAADPLVDGMGAAVRREGLRAGIVTCVPGRPRDARRRGFDHAEVLARGLARRLGLPLSACLVRVDVRPDQTSLSAVERRRNLRGAFAAAACPEPVVLVDDVLTTGATIGACAAALRRAGAPAVEVVVACRS
jgi:ComF family protein